MLKLNALVRQLDEETYASIHDTLLKSKAENSLQLLISYRDGGEDDGHIVEKLGISNNSFYVLKSRLHDRIQKHIIGDVYQARERIYAQLIKINDVLFEEPREITHTFLTKLEEDLTKYDMHSELLEVYSALKKVHLFSDRYYHYSQLYNRHAAFHLALEKSEETLGSFSRTLSEYDASRSVSTLETLRFMCAEMGTLFELNGSRQIQIALNLMHIQIILFGGINPTGQTVGQLLKDTDSCVTELAEIFLHKKYQIPLWMLQFEFHFRNGQEEEASHYFNLLISRFNRVLLFSNSIHSSGFLLSVLSFAVSMNRLADLPPGESLLVDSSDSLSQIRLGLYQAMHRFYNGETKAAINILNDLLNKHSLKDLVHLCIELRLTLAFLYLVIKDYDLADSHLRNTKRKMKSDEAFNHVNHLVRVLQNTIRSPGKEKNESDKDEITLFIAKNNGRYRMVIHLLPALKDKYVN